MTDTNNASIGVQSGVSTIVMTKPVKMFIGGGGVAYLSGPFNEVKIIILKMLTLEDDLIDELFFLNVPFGKALL